MTLARLQEQSAILEALGAERRDPQIRIGMVDVGRDHAAGAQVKSKLHGDEHDREQDADQRHDEANAVVEQVAEGERQDHLLGPCVNAGAASCLPVTT